MVSTKRKQCARCSTLTRICEHAASRKRGADEDPTGGRWPTGGVAGRGRGARGAGRAGRGGRGGAGKEGGEGSRLEELALGPLELQRVVAGQERCFGITSRLPLLPLEHASSFQDPHESLQ